MNTRPTFIVATLALLSVAELSQAQDPRATLRVDPRTRMAVNAIIDSARAQGLPPEPLTDKMIEGASKGADGPRIISAVRTLALEMGRAHRALGTAASADEIKAAAAAMHAGVPAVELGKLKKEGGLRRSLALPFTVLADIVSRGVPVGTAANAMRVLVGAGAKDQEINDFQRKVSADIDNGAPPAAAVETRAKGKPEEQL